jgi:hypothetical protein
MNVSLLLLLKFVYDIVKRLIHDAYFRSLGLLVLIMAGIGTLFFWLVEGRTFLQALAYAVGTLAMNSPYGLSWGPATTGGHRLQPLLHLPWRGTLPHLRARSGEDHGPVLRGI